MYFAHSCGIDLPLTHEYSPQRTPRYSRSAGPEALDLAVPTFDSIFEEEDADN
jgi:hypothetical protein